MTRLLRATVVAMALLAGSGASASAEELRIRTLSARADLLTGGDALVEVMVPPGVRATPLRVTVAGRDVSGAFSAAGEARFVGRVDVLPEGRSTIEATIGRHMRAQLTVVNHPRGGPTFAGPQIQPWACTTEAHGLGPAVDAQCNVRASAVRYVYKDATTGELRPYDPAQPPADSAVARTTTDEDKAVRYVVRVERGTLDRAIYDIALLAEPDQAPVARNRKLCVPFGGSCSARFSQPAPGAIEVSQSAPDGAVLLDRQLARGFAVATTGLNTLGQNCNLVVSAEALALLKEHITETYGAVRYTIGEGCPGGSMQQHFIADTYPERRGAHDMSVIAPPAPIAPAPPIAPPPPIPQP